MIFPIRDVIPSRTTPIVTWLLIGLNVAVHVAATIGGDDAHTNTLTTFGLVPAAFSWTAVLTSMFLHANLVHLGSNMLSLWIFGDNVEDQLGHGRFLLFYLLCGVFAALAETSIGSASWLPMVGASGAIAGVMGGYLMMFPKSRVLVLVFLIFYITVVEITAVFFLAFWFLIQVAGGLGRSADAATTGGVAFLAHAGGFLAGASTVRFLRRRERDSWLWRDEARGGPVSRGRPWP
ncbi:MAG: rhomboid family intramembrane serine protease [Acidobacteria bacterium]|nr:rhomboid family intramembrane serine protease [Acidobacteriota bacterium]